MSDWFATHSTVEAANSGLDQEMPAGMYPIISSQLLIRVTIKHIFRGDPS